ncbi:hypothetical protein DPX16_4850 [Anabarilius grahami]|uniref:Uncharacterized protein n=1 Tax=Anabarilius grahami TaxID=495550 RepID=A0A3N0ZAP0_ANAGA|nr:hypothetical protein DPX16_4850 [Anabarilius grahami]
MQTPRECHYKKQKVSDFTGASQYPSSFPRSSVLNPMTRKPIELSHLEGHLNSLIAPRGGDDRGVRKLPEESRARIQRCILCGSLSRRET